mmetsp:Transcript_40579/g.71385  ORF Transcript_40579/g.71385 Transcript_40579/m.71385 type:complete len:203 (+) Transcript_40579:102-710(+)
MALLSSCISRLITANLKFADVFTQLLGTAIIHCNLRDPQQPFSFRCDDSGNVFVSFHRCNGRFRMLLNQTYYLLGRLGPLAGTRLGLSVARCTITFRDAGAKDVLFGGQEGYQRRLALLGSVRGQLEGDLGRVSRVSHLLGFLDSFLDFLQVLLRDLLRRLDYLFIHMHLHWINHHLSRLAYSRLARRLDPLSRLAYNRLAR